MPPRKSGILAVLGSCIAIFWTGAFIFGFPGVMAKYWQDSFEVGRGAIGNTMFFVLAAVGMLMFVVGRWQERFGLRAMVTVGAIMCGLDIIVLACPSSLYLVYLWAYIMGVASCFIYIPGLTTVQRWFPSRRGLVSGIVNCTFGLSAAVMSPVFGYMLSRMGCFYMCVVLGIIALVLGTVAAQFTSPPEAVGAPMPTAPSSAVAHVPVLPLQSMTVAESLSTRSFWLLWVVWALQGAASIAMVMLATQFGLWKGWALASAVTILTAFNITNGLSRVVLGYLSDIIGRNLAMSLVFLAAGAAYFVLPYVDSLPATAILAAVIGASLGTLFAVSAPLTTDCFGLAHFGAIFGLVFTAYGFVAAPLGPSLSGYVLDLTSGNFPLVFGYLGTFCIISGILIHFVVPPGRE